MCLLFDSKREGFSIDVGQIRRSACLTGCVAMLRGRSWQLILLSQSQVVQFDSRAGSQLPIFRYGGGPASNKDSFKCLGMHFTHNGDMVAAAERVVPIFHADHLRKRQFASEHGLEGTMVLRWLPAADSVEGVWAGTATIILAQGNYKYDREEGAAG
eukprot:1144727-Pelagomonas_calceolata.AAC.2